MMVIAVFILNIGHPGLVFSQKKTEKDVDPDSDRPFESLGSRAGGDVEMFTPGETTPDTKGA